MDMIAIVKQLADRLGELAINKGIMISTAESCTGGWVSEMITSVPGSSGWFDRGFITYSNTAKEEMLGVDTETLEKHGAVSEQTAREMAQGALEHSHAQISVAITGIAGPGGGTEEKPVGTIWFAWSDKKNTIARKELFSGDRYAIRQQAVITALKGLLELME